MLIIKDRVEYGSWHAVIIRDSAAGLPDRFTVYMLPSCPSHRVRIVGRELTLAHAKRLAKGA